MDENGYQAEIEALQKRLERMKEVGQVKQAIEERGYFESFLEAKEGVDERDRLLRLCTMVQAINKYQKDPTKDRVIKITSSRRRNPEIDRDTAKSLEFEVKRAFEGIKASYRKLLLDQNNTGLGDFFTTLKTNLETIDPDRRIRNAIENSEEKALIGETEKDINDLIRVIQLTLLVRLIRKKENNHSGKTNLESFTRHKIDPKILRHLCFETGMTLKEVLTSDAFKTLEERIQPIFDKLQTEYNQPPKYQKEHEMRNEEPSTSGREEINLEELVNGILTREDLERALQDLKPQACGEVYRSLINKEKLKEIIQNVAEFEENIAFLSNKKPSTCDYLGQVWYVLINEKEKKALRDIIQDFSDFKHILNILGPEKQRQFCDALELSNIITTASELGEVIQLLKDELREEILDEWGKENWLSNIIQKINPNELLGKIETPEALNGVLQLLTLEQCGEVCEDLAKDNDKLGLLFENEWGENFRTILKDLTPEKREAIYPALEDALKDVLTTHIEDPYHLGEQLGNAMKFLTPKQCGEVFPAWAQKNELSVIASEYQRFWFGKHLLGPLTVKQCKKVCEAWQKSGSKGQKLSDIIQSKENFDDFTKSLQPGQKRAVFEVLPKNLNLTPLDSSEEPELLDKEKESLEIIEHVRQSSKNLHILQKMSADELKEGFSALAKSEEKLSDFFREHGGGLFGYTLRDLNGQQRTAIYDALKNKLPDIIKNFRELEYAIERLTPKQCSEVYCSLAEQGKFPDVIQSTYGVPNILELLYEKYDGKKPPDEFWDILIEKGEFRKIIKYLSDFTYTLEHLGSKKQRQFCDALDLSNIITTASELGEVVQLLKPELRKEMLASWGQEDWLLNIIQSKNDFDTLIKELNNEVKIEVLAPLLKNKVTYLTYLIKTKQDFEKVLSPMDFAEKKNLYRRLLAEGRLLNLIENNNDLNTARLHLTEELSASLYRNLADQGRLPDLIETNINLIHAIDSLNDRDRSAKLCLSLAERDKLSNLMVHPNDFLTVLNPLIDKNDVQLKVISSVLKDQDKLKSLIPTGQAFKNVLDQISKESLQLICHALIEQLPDFIQKIEAEDARQAVIDALDIIQEESGLNEVQATRPTERKTVQEHRMENQASSSGTVNLEQINPDELLLNIKYPEDLNDQLQRLTPEQCGEVCLALASNEHRRKRFFQNHGGKNFSTILTGLNPELRDAVYHALKSKLPEIIKDYNQLADAVENLTPEQCGEVYCSLVDLNKLSIVIKNVSQFTKCLEKLTPEQLTKVWDVLAERGEFPNIIQDCKGFQDVLEFLKSDQPRCDAVYDALKSKLPKIIENYYQLAYAVKNLTPEQCGEVYCSLVDLIESDYEFQTCLQELTPEQLTKVWDVLAERGEFPKIIKNFVEFRSMLKFLKSDAEKQRQICDVLLPNFIKRASELGKVIQLLKPELRSEMLHTWGQQNWLSNIIKSQEDFDNLIKELDEELKQEVIEVLAPLLKDKVPHLTYLIQNADDFEKVGIHVRRTYTAQKWENYKNLIFDLNKQGRLAYLIENIDVFDNVQGILKENDQEAYEKFQKDLRNIFNTDPGRYKTLRAFENELQKKKEAVLQRERILYRPLQERPKTELQRIIDEAHELQDPLKNLGVFKQGIDDSSVKECKNLCVALTNNNEKLLTFFGGDKNPNEFSNLLGNLSSRINSRRDQEKRKAIYDALKSKLPDIIKNSQQLARLLKVLTPEECKEVVTQHGLWSSIIRTQEDFESFLQSINYESTEKKEAISKALWSGSEKQEILVQLRNEFNRIVGSFNTSIEQFLNTAKEKHSGNQRKLEKLKNVHDALKTAAENLSTTLDQTLQKTWEATPQAFFHAMEETIKSFKNTINDQAPTVDEVMGHGFLFRAAEVILKAIGGLLAGILWVLGAVIGQGVAREAHRNVYKQTFFAWHQTKPVSEFKGYRDKIDKDMAEAKKLINKPQSGSEDSEEPEGQNQNPSSSQP